MEALAMKGLVFLTFFASTSLGALVPLTPIVYSDNLIASQGRDRFPVIERTDGGLIVYNVPQVNTNVRTIPTAVFANGRPMIAHIPTTYNYYGTPIYDFRFPLNPVLPGAGSKPSIPGFIPRPETPRPPPIEPENNDDDDDDDDRGIEKLDEKVEPAYDPLGEAAGAAADSEENDDDSIAIYPA